MKPSSVEIPTKNEDWETVPATQGSEWQLLLQPTEQRRPVINRQFQTLALARTS